MYFLDPNIVVIAVIALIAYVTIIMPLAWTALILMWIGKGFAYLAWGRFTGRIESLQCEVDYLRKRVENFDEVEANRAKFTALYERLRDFHLSQASEAARQRGTGNTGMFEGVGTGDLSSERPAIMVMSQPAEGRQKPPPSRRHQETLPSRRKPPPPRRLAS